MRFQGHAALCGVGAIVLFVLAGISVGEGRSLACVIDPPGICTKDINPCGHPSSCVCPVEYVYDPAAGKCLLDLSTERSAVPIDIATDECVREPPDDAVCTKDINDCGNATHCDCTAGFTWNPAADKCLRNLDRP